MHLIACESCEAFSLALTVALSTLVSRRLAVAPAKREPCASVRTTVPSAYGSGAGGWSPALSPRTGRTPTRPTSPTGPRWPSSLSKCELSCRRCRSSSSTRRLERKLRRQSQRRPRQSRGQGRRQRGRTVHWQAPRVPARSWLTRNCWRSQSLSVEGKKTGQHGLSRCSRTLVRWTEHCLQTLRQCANPLWLMCETPTSFPVDRIGAGSSTTSLSCSSKAPA